MKYRVKFYTKENGRMPVDEFLSGLGDKQREKVYRSIDLLECSGANCIFPKSMQ